MTDNEIFNKLNTFFISFKSTCIIQAEKKFLAVMNDVNNPEGVANKIKELKPIYEEVIRFAENEAVSACFRDDLLEIQRNLYAELEYILSLNKNNDRHHFLIVVPVADRPLLLKKCIDSLIEQCRLFQYGALTLNKDNLPVYEKIRLFIIDDSKEEANINKIKKISSSTLSSGIQSYYVGLDEQTEFLKQIPADYRGKLSRIIGNFNNSSPPRKGASITRNIAYLYLYSILHEFPKKTLVYFLDSDEEFRIKIKCANKTEDIPFINYFYWIDNIFNSSDAEALTGKVVGDPPVSPSVMINTFLNDLILFLADISDVNMYDKCGFHEVQLSEAFSAEYHDMAELFGYKKQAFAKKYQCRLSRSHTNKTCLEDFSKRILGFFYGLHSTRPQYYNHCNNFTETEDARTVYTGNYIFNEKGFRHFIPFANLKLRMAGPTLGRILKQKLKHRFVSANLPLLHSRTISHAGMNEFRSGIFKDNNNIDLSLEYKQQFWGDVMLFAIDKLTSIGFPEKRLTLGEITDIVFEVQLSLLRLYSERQAEITRKISIIKEQLSCSEIWRNLKPKAETALNDIKLFCSLVESNFGISSLCLRRISNQIVEKKHTYTLINAIHYYYEDDCCWNELLNMGIENPCFPETPVTISTD